MILQDTGKNAWMLAGYYPRLNSIGEHDGQWYLSKAREYKEKAQLHNAWFYYLTAWDLLAPVNFMGTPQLDKLADEMQAVRPSDLPSARAPLEIATNGKTFKIAEIAAVTCGRQSRSAGAIRNRRTPANPTLASQDNAAVMKALADKVSRVSRSLQRSGGAGNG